MSMERVRGLRWEGKNPGEEGRHHAPPPGGSGTIGAIGPIGGAGGGTSQFKKVLTGLIFRKSDMKSESAKKTTIRKLR